MSVVVTGLRQKTEFIDSFNRAFATDAELVDILKEKSAEWAGARIVSSIPGRHFSQRIVHFPFVDRKRIEKALPFEIEDSLPFPLDDVEIDHFILDKAGKNADKKTEASVLGMLLPKTVLRRHLDLLASAGIDPQVIVPSYIGLYFVSKMVPVEGSAVLIDGSDLCTKSGSSLTACRSFSSVQPTAAISHTLKAIEGDGGERVERAYLLSPNDRLSASLADLGDRRGACYTRVQGEEGRRSGESRARVVRANQFPQGGVRVSHGRHRHTQEKTHPYYRRYYCGGACARRTSG